MLCSLCPSLSMRPLLIWLPSILPVSKLESAICPCPVTCHEQQTGLQVIESHQPLYPEGWDERCVPPCQARNAITNFIFSVCHLVDMWNLLDPSFLTGGCASFSAVCLVLFDRVLLQFYTSLFQNSTWALPAAYCFSPLLFHTSHLSPQPHT